MIWIQVILIAGFAYLLFRFLTDPNSLQMRAWKKILGVLFVGLAIVVVIFPQTSNDLAHDVGVGRGADLLLYLLTLAFVFVTINHYMKDKQEQKRFVELARKVAILEANLHQKRRRK
jgi:small membrane protein